MEKHCPFREIISHLTLLKGLPVPVVNTCMRNKCTLWDEERQDCGLKHPTLDKIESFHLEEEEEEQETIQKPRDKVDWIENNDEGEFKNGPTYEGGNHLFTNIACPGCNKLFSVPKKRLSFTFVCPRCGVNFALKS